MTTATRNAVTSYAEAVLSAKILAGRLVKLACERHLRDLERDDLFFDDEEAQRAISFFGYLMLAEDKPFILEPWQEFIIGSLLGWKTKDGKRRFRVAYVEAAKGCGKSPLAAGLGLYALLADGKDRAEVYSAAVDRDQAKILFRDAVAMVKASPALSERIEFSGGEGNEWNMAYHATSSFFRPTSSEHTGGRGKSGFRVHCGLLDEVHEHPTSAMVDFMRANAKFDNALIFEITNSGYDRTTVCYQHHELSVRILEGVVENDSWFAYVCGLDPCEEHLLEGAQMPDEDCPECDDWRDESVWGKANPNLDVSISTRYLRELVAEAKAMVGKRNIVQRLNFCIWTNQNERWISDELWGKNEAKPEPEGDAFAGLVVNSSFDIASLVLWFPRTKSVLPFFWIPERFVEEHPDGPYSGWQSDGVLTVTDGDVTDHATIRAKIVELGKEYHIRTITTKRWNARDLQTQLYDDGFDVTEASDGMKDMAPGSKELEKLLAAEEIRHGGHPVLRAHAYNTAVKVDSEGNMRPNPEESSGNITGIQALVMAIGQALGEPEDDAAGVLFV